MRIFLGIFHISLILLHKESIREKDGDRMLFSSQIVSVVELIAL